MTKKIFFTPGPSELFPTVPAHLAEALNQKIGVISHREKKFQDLYAHTVHGLRTLLNLPDDYHILFLASATEIWERILQNCVSQTSYHCVNGSFSKRFYEFAGELGLTGIKMEVPFSEGFYPEKIQVPEQVEAICLTHNETSSGVCMPVEDINKYRLKSKDALIFVDAVSSLPYPAFDFAKIDSTYFSVQKCFGLPAGLGVWILNEKCIEKSAKLQKSGRSTGTYHSLSSLLAKSKVSQTPETPNALFIYLLGKVVEDMNAIGINNIRSLIDEKSDLIYNYLDQSSNFSIAVKDPRHRSQTTIVANTKISSAEVNKILDSFDLAVGTGYGNYKDQQIRIANFPAYSMEIVQKLVAALKEKIG